MKLDLIQRGRFSVQEWKKGVDNVVRFDYMGSSEFEGGALGASLRFIRNNLKEYDLTIQQVSAYGKQTRYFLFGPKGKEEEIAESIKQVALNKIYLMEVTYFDAACGNTNWLTPSSLPNLWWDIKNHFIWWLPHELQDKFITALRNGGA